MKKLVKTAEHMTILQGHASVAILDFCLEPGAAFKVKFKEVVRNSIQMEDAANARTDIT